ncbi:hypothetical protein M8C85_002863 [Salmonella enterica]|nr:hypothetical protein [Salmonella enterica]EEC0646684.1 hypothetical protein [Salmonella enterica subsp. enterica]EDH1768648.1 hypothetical protein [Salmonella enterica]EGL1304379.1 hypothetical protein [Salmonella enterica]EGL1416466.1 hypothetical protein [Salmonella enterica]
MAVRLVVDVNFSEKNGLAIYQRCEPLTGQVAREESAFVTVVMNVSGRVVKDINRQQALRKEILSVLKRFEEMTKGDGGNGC